MTVSPRHVITVLLVTLAVGLRACSESDPGQPDSNWETESSAGGVLGYSMERPFPSGIKTVAVQMLESREFRRNLEFQLSEALVKRIEMDTPYRIADKKTADTIITGEILEVEQAGLGTDLVTGLPREVGATIIVRFRWQDQRSGRILLEYPRFAYTVTYIPQVGESFETGMTRGLDGMAERMVERMETDW